MIPIQPDQEAAIRQFAVEVAGSRWADFEASQWNMGTHVEGV
jgi:hypothetical protein